MSTAETSGTRQRPWLVHAAGLAAGGGYLTLAVVSTNQGPVLFGMGLATVLGWGALALIWSKAAGRGGVILGWALLFRLLGLFVAPSWEDDYHRYLWDGYQLITTGNPYAEAPLAAFEQAELPEAMRAALDGVNHPELTTIYGPAAQVVFGVGAWLAPGGFVVLKGLFILIELGGWWALRRWLTPQGWLLALWCPLGVIELAFGGHPEALGVAAVALALAADRQGRLIGAAAWMGVAVATKALAWVLVPFVVVRAGWRGALGFAAVVLGFYLPFWLQGSAAEWPALRAMGRVFEFNSLGYAVIQAALGFDLARIVAPLVVMIGCIVGFVIWWRRGRGQTIPGAEIFGWVLIFSPVVNPWYGLWLLPFLALRPTAWGLGGLAALPLAYAYGFNLPGRAALGYQHPWWVRPLEAMVVFVATGWGRWRARLKGASQD